MGKEDKGPQFTSPPPRSNPADTARFSCVARPRVLLVDDDPDHRSSLALALTDAGYAVVEAPDGHGAIDYLLRTPSPNVILLDLVMPGLSGWDVLAVLRPYARLRRIPVIIVTGEPAAIQVPGTNVVGRMLKPVRLDELLALLRRHVNVPAAALQD